MPSKGRRRQAPNRRQRRARNAPLKLDVHGEVVLKSLNAMDDLMTTFPGEEDPLAAIGEEFEAAVTNFVVRL